MRIFVYGPQVQYSTVQAERKEQAEAERKTRRKGTYKQAQVLPHIQNIIRYPAINPNTE